VQCEVITGIDTVIFSCYKAMVEEGPQVKFTLRVLPIHLPVPLCCPGVAALGSPVACCAMHPDAAQQWRLVRGSCSSTSISGASFRSSSSGRGGH